jgi:hypothetical protein
MTKPIVWSHDVVQGVADTIFWRKIVEVGNALA